MIINTAADANELIQNLEAVVTAKLAQPGVDVRQLVQASLRGIARVYGTGFSLARRDIDTLTPQEITQGIYARLGGRRVTVPLAAALAAIWT